MLVSLGTGACSPFGTACVALEKSENKFSSSMMGEKISPEFFAAPAGNVPATCIQFNHRPTIVAPPPACPLGLL